MSASACCSVSAKRLVTQERLVRLVADGGLHSGRELAEQLGLSRAAVWKQVVRIRELGLEINAQAGQGYQLAEALELLDEAAIRGLLPAGALAQLDGFEVLWSVDSTSDYLLQQARVSPGRARLCIAEFQNRGRGRRGRAWLAPAGYSICLSLAWSFASSPANLSCLGLAAGVAVLRALRKAGCDAAQLKWPNDIVLAGQKLAGILVDVQGEAGGPLQAVIGVGMNYRLSAAVTEQIVATGGLAPAAVAGNARSDLTRNGLAALLSLSLLDVLQEFSRDGFDALAKEWGAADYLLGKTVTVRLDDSSFSGVARGIVADGRLQLDTAGGQRQVVTGDVSVRAAS